MQDNDLTCKETTKSRLYRLTQFVPNDVRQIVFKMAEDGKLAFDIERREHNLWRIYYETQTGMKKLHYCEVLACEEDVYELEQKLDATLDAQLGLNSHDVMDIMEVAYI